MRLHRVRNDLRNQDSTQVLRDVARYIERLYTGDAEKPRAAFRLDAFEVEACASAAPPCPPPLASCAPTACMPSMPAPVGSAPAPSRRKAGERLFGRSAGSAAPAELGALLLDLDEGFSRTLMRLIDERGFSDAQVYKRANLSRQLFSKIRKEEGYRPTKQTALALGVALELGLDELSMLLERAGYALTHASKADVIVEYFVTHGCYDVQVINQVLYEFDQPLLGSNAA